MSGGKADLERFTQGMREWASKPGGAVERARVVSRLRSNRFGPGHPIRKAVEALEGEMLTHQQIFEAVLRGGGRPRMKVRLDGCEPVEDYGDISGEGPGAQPNYVCGQWPEGGQWVRYDGAPHKAYLDGDRALHRRHMDREAAERAGVDAARLPKATAAERAQRDDDLVEQATAELESLDLPSIAPPESGVERERLNERLAKAQRAQAVLQEAPGTALAKVAPRLEGVRHDMEDAAAAYSKGLKGDAAKLERRIEKLEGVLEALLKRAPIGAHDGRIATLRRRAADVRGLLHWADVARQAERPWMSEQAEDALRSRAGRALDRTGKVLEAVGPAPLPEPPPTTMEAYIAQQLAQLVEMAVQIAAAAVRSGLSKLPRRAAPSP